MVFSDDVGYYIDYLFLVILEFLHKKKFILYKMQILRLKKSPLKNLVH